MPHSKQRLNKNQVPNQSKEFKELQATWYNRLKESGFEDIEKKNYMKWTTSQTLARSSNRNREVFFKSIEHYYRLAGYFRYDHIFTNKIDQFIWSLHSEGKTMREIVRVLKTVSTPKALTQVKDTIHKLRAIMYKKYEDLENEQK